MAHEHAGQSIIEMMWDQLDIQYASFIEMQDAGEDWGPDEIQEELETSTPEDAEKNATEIVKYLELKGKIAGLAYSIAKLRNPIKPNMDAIRAEMVERYVPPANDEDDD